jgi:hypothetical protein
MPECVGRSTCMHGAAAFLRQKAPAKSKTARQAPQRRRLAATGPPLGRRAGLHHRGGEEAAGHAEQAAPARQLQARLPRVGRHR